MLARTARSQRARRIGTAACATLLAALTLLSTLVLLPGQPLSAATPGVSATTTPVPVPARARTIGGIVWGDRDADGGRDPGEHGIPAVRVDLSYADGRVVDSRTTDHHGHYSFRVAPAAYTVQVATPAGYAVTYDEDGRPDGRTAVPAGEDDHPTADFGLARSATATAEPSPGEVDPTPALTLDKKASSVEDVDGNGVDVGDEITYTFEVANTGNVALAPVAVTDPKVASISCPVSRLAPGASTTCTADPYVLTQADLDERHVVNTARASGNPPGGDPADASDDAVASDATDTPLPGTSRMRLDKRADTVGPVTVGDHITYTFVVTNTSAVTLTDVSVTDDMVGSVACPVRVLAPGASTTCTAAPYTVTAGDVKNGAVVNFATAITTVDPCEKRHRRGCDVTDEDVVATDVRLTAGRSSARADRAARLAAAGPGLGIALLLGVGAVGLGAWLAVRRSRQR